MILIVGGRMQGKRAYAQTLCPEETWTNSLDGRAVYGLETIIRKLCQAGEDPLAVVLAHAKAHPDAVYVCDEVGSGVVPVDPEERAWREAVGRVCVALAEQADTVDRVVCGIPQRLKGDGKGGRV